MGHSWLPSFRASIGFDFGTSQNRAGGLPRKTNAAEKVLERGPLGNEWAFGF
jgi:hypothetical protein